MLVEPLLSAAKSAAESAAEASATAGPIDSPAIVWAWIIFVALLGTSVAGVPLVAWLIRRALPRKSRDPIQLEPVTFGSSKKVRRSPRHAVLQHRTLMAAVFVCILGILTIPALAALTQLGVSALQVAMGLVLPTLVVALHARQRDASR